MYKGHTAMHDDIIHVGMHKTGSTWLQRKLFPTVFGDVDYVGSNDFRSLLRELRDEEEWSPKNLVMYRSQYRQRCLFSFEGLSGVWWRSDTPHSRTVARLAVAFPTASVVIVVREPNSWMRSLYAHYIKLGGIVGFARFRHEVLNPEYADVASTVDRFCNHFDRVLVASYEEFVNDVWGFVAGIEEFGLVRFARVPPGRSNVSPGRMRLMMARLWNRCFRKSMFNSHPLFERADAESVGRRIWKRPKRKWGKVIR